MTEPSGSILTALFADGDRGLREAVRLYASVQQDVHITEIVATGNELLSALCSGAKADVLIVDALLPDMSVFEFLSRLGRLRLKMPPAVIITLCTSSDVLRKKLLTAGADFFMLKPYRLTSLFETAIFLACDTSTLQQRRASSHINWHMEQLKAPPGMEGSAYMRRILAELVRQEDATADELYRSLAIEVCTTPNTISKAVGRTVQAIWRQATPEYRALCEFYGEGLDRPLSNMKLIKGLAVRIRWELGL